MSSQGGYLCRSEHLASAHLADLAKQALEQDQQDPTGYVLVVAPMPGRHLVRLTFEGMEPSWYLDHSALPQRLSLVHPLPVHAYVLQPDEFEAVAAYAGGHRVGGERLRYDDLDLSEEELRNDALFARLQASWPLGHLAQVLGLTRQELLESGTASSQRLVLVQRSADTL